MRVNTSHTERGLFSSPQPIIIWNKIFALSVMALMFLTLSVSAKNVDASKAELVAKNFMSNKFSERNIEDLKISSSFTTTENNEALYHTFNFENGGFIIIAGDDRYEPIIGFSNESEVLENTNNENMITFLDGHKIQLKALKAGKLKVDNAQERTAKWEAIIQNKNTDNIYKVAGVDALTTTTWGQEKYYNKDCPADSGAVPENEGHVYTGCVTVAMSQLMNYHEWPAQGNGYSYYSDFIYGFQYADFANTTYNWDQMPDNLTGPNTEIAQLMYHCATSIITFFSTTYTAAFTVDVPKALIYHFGYDSDIKEVYRSSNTTGTSFTQIIRNELDDSRPVLMTGFYNVDPDLSHVWVIDGYDDVYYRMNWGWNGLANGWFLDNGEYYENLDPNDYDIEYYSNQYLIYNVKPGQGCEPIRRADIRVSYVTETTAIVNVMDYSYSNLYGLSGIDNKEIRYRRQGSNEAWTVVQIDPTFDYVELTDLQEGTQYEVQGRYECDNYGWSDYSVSIAFTTQGFSCTPVFPASITFGGVSDNGAFVYVPQPFDPKSKQVRYRVEGSGSAWTETTIDEAHFASLTGLQPGTTYEVQVRHECTDGVWTEYSGSATFTTTGTAVDGCPTPTIADIYTDTYYMYHFATTDSNWKKTQFRWRPVGSTGAWTETSASVRYYRRVKGVGIAYQQQVELQLRIQCQDGSWSDYSDSYIFTSQDNL